MRSRLRTGQGRIETMPLSNHPVNWDFFFTRIPIADCRQCHGGKIVVDFDRNLFFKIGHPARWSVARDFHSLAERPKFARGLTDFYLVEIHSEIPDLLPRAQKGVAGCSLAAPWFI